MNWLPVNYNELTWQERREVRNKYIEIQENKCYYCWWSLNEEPPKRIKEYKIDWSLFPKNFLEYPIHLQHNHNSWMTEWAVHSLCNAVMRKYEWR